MPVDRGAIDAQLREIGEGERWWEQREFRDLPYVLNPCERIYGITNGRLLGRRRPRLPSRTRWLMVATGERLICLQQERFGRKQVDIHFDQITGISHRSRLGAYEIMVEAPRRRYRIRIAKADAFRFMGAITPLISSSGERERTGSVPPALLPRLGVLSALPGMARLAAQVSGIAAPEPATRKDLARLEGTVERLEKEVEQLQQQVEFLEKLLQKRSEVLFSSSPASADPQGSRSAP
jgi:hypothetical protein